MYIVHHGIHILYYDCADGLYGVSGVGSFHTGELVEYRLQGHHDRTLGHRQVLTGKSFRLDIG